MESLSSAEATVAFVIGAGGAAHAWCRPDEPRAVTKGRCSVQPSDIMRRELGRLGGPRTQYVADAGSRRARGRRRGPRVRLGTQRFSHPFYIRGERAGLGVGGADKHAVASNRATLRNKS